MESRVPFSDISFEWTIRSTPLPFSCRAISQFLKLELHEIGLPMKQTSVRAHGGFGRIMRKATGMKA